MIPEPTVRTVSDGVARVSWPAMPEEGDFRAAVASISGAVERALTDHGRVEAWLDPEDTVSHRLATWSGMHREGVMRGGVLADGEHRDRIVYARLASDAPLGEPAGFRALLNSFLPRKRAISQLLVRDPDGRVLMCRLTYKKDWDLPGGVVEVGESPQLAAGREVLEELGLEVTPGRLLLTDWLPSWSGWDDALCLVFDGGVVSDLRPGRGGARGAGDRRGPVLRPRRRARARRRLHRPTGRGRARRAGRRDDVHRVRSVTLVPS